MHASTFVSAAVMAGMVVAQGYGPPAPHVNSVCVDHTITVKEAAETVTVTAVPTCAAPPPVEPSVHLPPPPMTQSVHLPPAPTPKPTTGGPPPPYTVQPPISNERSTIPTFVSTFTFTNVKTTTVESSDVSSSTSTTSAPVPAPVGAAVSNMVSSVVFVGAAVFGLIYFI